MARRGLSLLSWCVALAGLGLGVAHAVDSASLTDATAGWSFGLFLAALVIVITANRPPVIIVASAVSGVGTLAGSLWLDHQTDSGVPSSVPAEYLLLCCQLVLVGALAVFAGRRLGSRARSVIADGAIVAVGAWVVSWVVLVRPSIASSAGTTLTIGRGATLSLAIIIVFLLAVLMFSDSAPAASTTFLGASIVLELTGVILRAISVRPGMSLSASTVDAPLLMATVLAGAGLVHPSARDLFTPGLRRITPPLMARLVTTTTSLVVPIVILTITTPDGSQDRIVRTVSIAVLATVVMARVISSVRSNAATQEQLVRTALTDSLTGLPNRVLMLEHIQSALSESWGSSRQPTVLFIDVDRFKNINDSLGHSIGDDILTVVAKRLSNAVPAHATVARIAGDEFVVLDPTTSNATQSVLLAESVLDSFREPVHTGDGDMFVTASIGVAHAPKGVPMTADQLMRHADTAMYRAKDAGRNCIALFDDSMLETVTKRLDVETALYRALERGELKLLHQPIVDISLGLVVGFEALMRWDRGDAGVVSPAEFIPIAEETGTIVPLGSWALHDALRQLREWIDDGVCAASTTMSVNVSPRQLGDPQFVSVVSEALEASGVPPEQLWLEVTESVMITEPVQALSSLRRLTALGVRIAVDDFGTGYSSLSLLQRFPIQCIKIDRAFVNGIAQDEGTRNIVRTIIAMATAMDADIVAEGVETPDQLATLESLRCHKAQGYLIARPTPADQVPSLVKAIQDVDSIWKRG